MSFDADLTACAAIVEKGDPERFSAAMASPVQARRILFPLYAFNIEVSRAPWVTQEPMIAEMRLQWWRDALEEIAAGGAVRRHEVVTPLSQCLDAQAAQILDRAVAARRWDIYKDAFEDEAHFRAYLTETCGGIMLAGARALGFSPKGEATGALSALGYATGLARFLRAVPELEAQNRVPLLDGRAEAVAELARSALSGCPSYGRLRQMLGADARVVVVESYLTRAVLGQVAADPRRVADGTLGVGPLRRSFLLWRHS